MVQLSLHASPSNSSRIPSQKRMLSCYHLGLLQLNTTLFHPILSSLGARAIFFDLQHKDPGDHTTGLLHDSLEFFADC